MLSGWTDCQTRAFANQYPTLVAKKGYTLREPKNNAGAALGQGFHTSAHHILSKKTTDGALEAGKAVFLEEIKAGVQWDEDGITPNKETAFQQLDRMLRTWEPFSRGYVPLVIEQYLSADLGDDFELTGHIDVDTVDGRLIDHKSGKRRPSPQVQLGGYALLARTHKLPVKAIEMHYVARTSLKQPQAPVIREVYDLVASQKAAMTVINQIKQSVIAFEQTGDPTVFTANASSRLCSAKYCKAHGTPFCSFWRAES